MKRSFLLFCLFVCSCFVFQAAAQELLYTVTETELTELESISQNLRISRQKQLLQASALAELLKAQEKKAKILTEKLQQAESTATDLRNQLQTEQTALINLKKSYTAYEAETAAALKAKQTEIDTLKTKLYRRTIALAVLSALLAVSALFTVFKWYLKSKLHLFPP